MTFWDSLPSHFRPFSGAIYKGESGGHLLQEQDLLARIERKWRYQEEKSFRLKKYLLESKGSKGT